MIVAGLTGGLATGKSFVANALGELGAHVIEADALGHDVLRRSGEGYAAAVNAFGESILGTNGEIDRSKLAARVFGRREELAKLNAIVHPAVRERARRMAEDAAKRDSHAVVIYVAAILLESGGLEGMKKLIVVHCSPEQQMQRALERPGATRESVESRLAHQMPQAEKAARADYRIDTGGTMEDTLRQTKMVFEELKKLA